MFLVLFIVVTLLSFARGDYCDATTTDLVLNYRYLTVFPDLSMCTSLVTLDLSYSQLTTIPAEVGQLVNLQSLNLWSNQLTTIPAEIGQLVNLQHLYLMDNQLTTLPTEIGQLVNLQSLSLNVNQLITIPAEIGQLVNLQYLELSSNQLTAIPAAIGQLVNLQYLYLWSNQLTTLPTEIGQLNLQVNQPLSLEGNPIVCLPAIARDHAGWLLGSYPVCDPTVAPTVSPTDPSAMPTMSPTNPTSMPTISTNSSNATTYVNFTTAIPLIKPTPMRSRLRPFTELYERATTPATKRQQPTVGSSKATSNAHAGDEIKSKINQMREKVAVMRGEL
jgi:Leucine-rich repeat (LRR) protein